MCGGVRQPFAIGEVLFAAAGVEHRFVDFTDDFLTWVFPRPKNLQTLVR